jgi:hypothetical protein
MKNYAPAEKNSFFKGVLRGVAIFGPFYLLHIFEE